MRDLLEQQPTAADDRRVWQLEYDRRLFQWAADRVRGSFQAMTWRAFWLTAVLDKSGKETAAELGMTVAAVYVARSRVMARLKAELEQVSRELEDSEETPSH